MMDVARDPSGLVTVHFEAIEIDLLRLVTAQLVDLLGAAAADTLTAAADPALRRMLPDAYRDDPEAAAEFRRFTASGILDGKLVNGRTVLADLNDASPLSPVSESEEADWVDELYEADATDATDQAAETDDTNVTDDTDDTDDTDETAEADDAVPDLVPITLDAAALQSWLRTLTDLRLTIAERLQISPDGVQHLTGEEAPVLRDVYDWLGMVQESLVYAIDT